jgi:esterase/lipase
MMHQKSKTVFVSFAGYALKYGGIPKKEFATFLGKHFSHIDAQFYIDFKCKSYHYGITDITNNVEETVEYLKEQLKNYDKIICLGVSAGGYAALLFGSLLNAHSVIAFIPQTLLKGEDKLEKYKDLKEFINDTTRYYLFADDSVKDPSNCHHVSQCLRIANISNVQVIRKPNINVQRMRDTGELYEIVNNVVKIAEDN